MNKNKALRYWLSILFFWSAIFLSSLVNGAQAQTKEMFAPDEVVVTYLKNVTTEKEREEIVENVDSVVREKMQSVRERKANKPLAKIRTKTIKVPKGRVREFITRLKKIKGIETAEPNYIAQKTVTTNDPSLSSQWGLFKIEAANLSGQSAWDITAGSSAVKVAVLDTGVQSDHPDLVGKVVNESNFTSSPSTADIDGHGTHVAGTIAAATNNALGVAGAGYDTVLLNGKVLGDSGWGYYDWIAGAIIWATDSGAKVINLSLGGTAPHSVLENAVNYAWSHGVVVIAAAGNSGSSSSLYPAYYTNALAVAATNQSDQKPSWSSYGTWVDIAAPGDTIYATYKGSSYVYMSGTSMATPMVSGVAALLAAYNNCNNVCIRGGIEQTADPITGTGSFWQNGRVNAYRAVLSVWSLTPTQTPIQTPTPTLSPTDIPTPTSAPTPTNSGPTITPSPTSTPSPTPTPTVAQQPVMTVSNIEMWYTSNGKRRDIYTKVMVIDQSNSQPLPQAKISLKIVTPSNVTYTGSGTTNSQGQVTFILRRQTVLGNYVSTITNVTKSGYTYAPSVATKTLNVQ